MCDLLRQELSLSVELCLLLSAVQDGDGILCQFIQVTDIALDETNGESHTHTHTHTHTQEVLPTDVWSLSAVLNNSLTGLIDDEAANVDNVLQRLNGLSTGMYIYAIPTAATTFSYGLPLVCALRIKPVVCFC